MIPFDKPTLTGKEIRYIEDVNAKGIHIGQSEYTAKCEQWISGRYGGARVQMTFSGTTALEVACQLLDLKPGDEIIVPAYSFPSCANAIIRAGGLPVITDIELETAGLSPEAVLACLTARTKAIMCIHYAGIDCRVKELRRIADEHGVVLIEDAAQAFLSATGGQMLGTWGNLSTLSFNSKKTIHCGQGGAIVINDASYFKRAEILRDRGTNRAQFLAGEVDEYSWQEPGTSFSPSELNMAFLYAQLEAGESIVQRTREIFFRYAAALEPLASAGLCTLPGVAEKHGHNGSLFYLLLPDLSQRQELIAYLKQNAIIAQFHFVPLHLGEGRKFTKIPFFPSQSQELYERLVRLPLFHAMSDAEVDYVAKHVAHFFSDRTAKIKKS